MSNVNVSNNSNKIKRIAGIAIFSAIIIVLQVLSAVLGRFTALPFSITLTLIPIVVGSAVYGVRTGAFLGGVFGAVVLVLCIAGMDPGGNILWLANPLLTALLCFVKGIAAGFMAGVCYALFAKKNAYIGVALAAIVSPVVNTGIFCAAMVLFYNNILTEWAGGTSALSFIIFGIAGINFIIEIGSNIVLSPVASRVLNIKSRM